MISKLRITGLIILVGVLIGMPACEVWNMEAGTGLETAMSIMAGLMLSVLFAGFLWVLAEVWK